MYERVSKISIHAEEDGSLILSQATSKDEEKTTSIHLTEQTDLMQQIYAFVQSQPQLIFALRQELNSYLERSLPKSADAHTEEEEVPSLQYVLLLDELNTFLNKLTASKTIAELFASSTLTLSQIEIAQFNGKITQEQYIFLKAIIRQREIESLAA